MAIEKLIRHGVTGTALARQDVASTSRPPIAPLRPDWIPAGGPDWLEHRRVWHQGQLRAHQRTMRALREARGGDFEALAEDERLAATELLRIITTIAGDLRMLDEPVARRVDGTERTVWAVRRWLRLDSDQAAVAGVTGERSVPPKTPTGGARGRSSLPADARSAHSVAA